MKRSKKKTKCFKTKLPKALRKELEEAVDALYLFSIYDTKRKADSGLLKLVTDYIDTYGEDYAGHSWYLHIDLRSLVDRVIDELAERNLLR